MSEARVDARVFSVRLGLEWRFHVHPRGIGGDRRGYGF